MTSEDFKMICEDYKEPEDLLFDENSTRVNVLKTIINNDLDEIERRIIILYAELGSLRKLGKELGVSASSAYIKIREIKKKIITLFNTKYKGGNFEL